ncbi:DUF349 domain-containing protein [Actinotalea solisilvae]|uniref:DUF349 domain-containing protein n=1 Tax=Actinotalea solisilvae TaxID=2072922 RepID=UPI0027DDD142|nr:DUF349 domain-containing protein [Actinotalea solisilvae]
MTEQERTDDTTESTPVSDAAQVPADVAAEQVVVETSAEEQADEAEQAEPAADEPVEQTEAPAADEPAEQTEAPAADEPAEQTEAPTADEPAEQTEAPATDEQAERTEPTEPAPDAPVEDAPEQDAPAEAPASAEATPSEEPTPSADDEPAPEAASAEAPGATTAEAPSASPTGAAPRPTPRPTPRPPTPAAVRPAAPAAAAAPLPTPHPPALTPAESAEAARWGRVDDDGTVWVREATGERAVGQYPGADTADALAFYVRRFADLHAKVLLLETRLATTDLPVKEIDSTLEHLTAELAEPAAVGDLDSLRSRLDALRAVADERRAEADAQRAAAKQAAIEARTAIVEAAEKIAGTEPDRIQWRPAGEQLRTLLDQWKDAQRHGPRIDRTTEDALWKRFSHARSTFDRERRRFFAELEKHNTSAKAEKTALVAEAERLATSTEWGPTSAAYRDLMARWKAAGRASRKDDDALWARFRAAQDQFFAARDASQKQTDEEFGANLQVKLALLEEAERLVPVRDLAAARASLREIQERWEKAGKVPRNDVQRVEGRLRAVEQAVRDAEQAQWQRSNPETRARAEGALAQLTAAIAGLEADLEKARAAGDQRKIADAQAALDARRAWLEQVERAAAESR